MLPVSRGLEFGRVVSSQIAEDGYFPFSKDYVPTIFPGENVSKIDAVSGLHRRRQLMAELEKNFDTSNYTEETVLSWPVDVKLRWKSLNDRKSKQDIGFLTWNVNGRLDLRGCRESLLRRWVLGGSVDVVMIQEHFQKGSANMIGFLNPDWCHVSSNAVGGGIGRKSGGCAVFVQPCLISDSGFTLPGGRICGIFVGDGLIVTIYFPTISPGQSREEFFNTFTLFVDRLILFIEDKIGQHPVKWIICGTDTNSHFKGTGRPPRRKDDFAAMQVRRFMKKFDHLRNFAHLSSPF